MRDVDVEREVERIFFKLFSCHVKLPAPFFSSQVTMSASENNPVDRAGTMKSAIVSSVLVYSSTIPSFVSSGVFHEGKFVGVARSVC